MSCTRNTWSLNGNVPHNPHQEDPGLPGYTSQGNDCGSQRRRDASSLITTLDNRTIETWMEGPFHALGIIDPRFRRRASGASRGSGTNTQMSRDWMSYVADRLWKLPCLLARRRNNRGPPGLRSGESPNPLTRLSGVQRSLLGLPLILQLGSGNVTPNVTAHSLVGSGGQLDSCVFDETNYANPDAPQPSRSDAVFSTDVMRLC